MIACYTPHSKIDLVGKCPDLTLSGGTAPTISPGVGGIAWYNTATTQRQGITLPSGKTAATVACCMQATSTSVRHTPWAIHTNSGANGDFFVYSTAQRVYTSTWAGVRWISAYTLPRADRILSPHVTVQVGSTTATTHATYVAGELVNAKVNATFSDVTSVDICADVGFGYPGWIYGIAFWDRMLNDGEIASISQNFWQLFV